MSEFSQLSYYFLNLCLIQFLTIPDTPTYLGTIFLLLDLCEQTITISWTIYEKFLHCFVLNIEYLIALDITSPDIINSSRALKMIFVLVIRKKPAFGTTPSGPLVSHKVYTHTHVPENQEREAANPFPAISYDRCISCLPTTFLGNVELGAKNCITTASWHVSSERFLGITTYCCL